MSEPIYHKLSDTVLIPRAEYEAYRAAHGAIEGFLQYVNGQSGELYQTVYRRLLDASNVLRAAGIQTEGEGK